MRRAFTLIELLITIGMFVVITAVALYIFKVVLLTWSSQENREGGNVLISRGVESMARTLRSASAIPSLYSNEIRFTVEENGADVNYIYYLYNLSDTYVPPPAFNQSSYQLRKAALTGFTYGSGDIVLIDVLPPPASELSVSGNMATVDLSVRSGVETVRSRMRIRPRNL